MRRIRWRVGGLYWRLTLSYFLVTLVAALTVDVALTLVPLIQQYQQADGSGAKELTRGQELEQQESPQIAPYLEQAMPDQQALRQWVLRPLLAGSGLVVKGSISLVAVLEPRGTLLSACAAGASRQPSCGADALQAAQDTLALTAVQSAIQPALAGNAQAADARPVTAAGQSVIAVPIVAYNGHPLGALVLVVDGAVSTTPVIPSGGLPRVGSFIAAFAQNLQPGAFYFILLAAAIGTLTGMLITRNLTRRLRRMTRAADAWSQGDFSASAHDRSRDELGQLARDLDAMAIELRQLVATRQQLAVAEERNRLARDLHDSVKQQVFAGALLVGAARAQLPAGNDTVRGYLAEAEELAERTRRELTDLIRELRPARLDGKGLVAALHDEAAEWSRRTGIAVEVRAEAERATPAAIAEALSRVAQEALANVARHSGAHSASVRLTWDDDSAVRLTIADDGRGFDVARASAAGAGAGLASMRERVEALGGGLRIVSGPDDTGTVLDARIPLPDASVSEETEETEEIVP